jgi:hypothetical protein
MAVLFLDAEVFWSIKGLIEIDWEAFSKLNAARKAEVFELYKAPF